MNTFKHGDDVFVHGQTKTVSYIQGPYVYFNGGRNSANYQECTLIGEPKFKPGDVVSNGYKEFTIRCVKSEIGAAPSGIAYDYTEGGFDFESGLTLIRSAVPIIDLIRAGKRIEAIKQHRIINSSGLLEAKNAIQALERELTRALKSKVKAGDYVVTCIANTGEDGRNHFQYSSRWKLTSGSPSIVILQTKYGLAPSNTPLVHATRELAETEARRLAVKHPGCDFVVFTLASTSSAPKPVTPVATTVTA